MLLTSTRLARSFKVQGHCYSTTYLASSPSDSTWCQTPPTPATRARAPPYPAMSRHVFRACGRTLLVPLRSILNPTRGPPSPASLDPWRPEFPRYSSHILSVTRRPNHYRLAGRIRTQDNDASKAELARTYIGSVSDPRHHTSLGIPRLTTHQASRRSE